jgi:hypothetical protein
MTSSRLGQKVRIRGAGGGPLAGAKITGGGDIIATDASYTLDPSGTVNWGTDWVNASNEIVIPAGYDDGAVFDIRCGATLSAQTAPANGIVRIEYQRSTGGAFSQQWAVTVGWEELEAARADVNDYFTSFTFLHDLLTGWKVRWRMLNSTDVSVECSVGWISVEAIGAIPA